MEKKERMRIKGITMILSCLLLFAGCGENGGSEENVSTETAGQKVSEENSGMGQADAGMEFVELPVQTEQKLTENDFKVMKSLVGIQTGERQGSGVIYDEEENRILDRNGRARTGGRYRRGPGDISGRNTGGCHRRGDSGQLRSGFPVGGQGGTVRGSMEGLSAGADGSGSIRCTEGI